MNKDSSVLPLTEKEILSYFEKYKNGDISARKVLILFTMSLVKERVEEKYSRIPYSKEELIATGMLGLITAIDTFTPNNGIDFCRYAHREIDCEIGAFIRRSDYYAWIEHLEEPVVGSEEEYQVDALFDERILEVQYENQEIVISLYQWLDTLSKTDKKMLMLQFGFYGKVYNPFQTSEILNMYPSTIDRRTKRLMQEFKEYYEGVRAGEMEISKTYKMN